MLPTKKCSVCAAATICDQCGQRFETGLCMHARNHFCSEKCLDDWLEENVFLSQSV